MQDRFHLQAQAEIHDRFAASCTEVLSAITSYSFAVRLRNVKISSLAAYYGTLIDEAYIFYSPNIRQYVHAGFTFPFFMPPKEGYAAELSFSVPLAFALRDYVTFGRVKSARWADENAPYEVTGEDYEVTIPPISDHVIGDLLGGLASAWRPIAEVEIQRIEFENIPAIGRVYYGIPENREKLSDPPDWKTDTHMANQIVFCEFDVTAGNVSEWMSLHYHRLAVEYFVRQIEEGCG